MYHLEKYNGKSTRYRCPQCNENKQFTKYVNNETGEYLADFVGICNRINSCGYHYSPMQYFQDNPTRKYHFEKTDQIKIANKSIIPPSYIPTEYTSKSVQLTHDGSTNNFIHYIRNLIGSDKTKDIISQFNIGTSMQFPGATIFWQIDMDRKVRTGKIIQYDPITGKRNKEISNHIRWVHSLLKKSKSVNTYCLQQCLFGLHQLFTAPIDKSIGIVESEKTAIIASIYLPELIWLATGGIQNLSSQMLAPIASRKIVLFPDLNGYDLWKEKSYKIQKDLSVNIVISDLLERKAAKTDLSKGFDIADYLILCYSSKAQVSLK